ncbi:glycosyltransferase [Candidatus Saccharibacteria bacterium]|nr:glycosyltransferase [Candidatus Saccharibacteria bacterium]
MKIALAHDWFDVFGGAEKTVLAMAEMFPDAELYTLLFDDYKFAEYFKPSKVHTSFLQKVPRAIQKHHRLLTPLIPKAIASFDLNDFDLVLSSSSAFAKNVTVSPTTLHVTYCHTPMRFAWDYSQQYIKELGYGKLKTALAKREVKKLRTWDLKGNSGVNVWLTNSKTTQERIKRYYKKDSEVIYPPADLNGSFITKNRRDYYITLSTLTPYKKLELVIEAFAITGKTLFIIGDGPDRKRLEKLAPSNVKFAGFVEDKKKWELIAAAQGLIFPQEEDFGLAPIDAMACGTPVLAFAKGGVLETVEHKKSGVLFTKQTVRAINRAVEVNEKLKYDRKAMRKHALTFEKKHFQKLLKKRLIQAVKERA